MSLALLELLSFLPLVFRTRQSGRPAPVSSESVSSIGENREMSGREGEESEKNAGTGFGDAALRDDRRESRVRQRETYVGCYRNA